VKTLTRHLRKEKNRSARMAFEECQRGYAGIGG
jgi:hypothetical protein